jgi:hypothetical protein
MNKVIGTFIFGSAMLIFSGCTNDTAVTPDTTTTATTITPNTDGKITFASVNPIFIATCSGSSCHTGKEKPLLVNNYSIAKANGALIVSEVVSKRMPENGSLTAAEITAIKQWQTDGFLEK